MSSIDHPAYHIGSTSDQITIGIVEELKAIHAHIEQQNALLTEITRILRPTNAPVREKPAQPAPQGKRAQPPKR